MFHLSVPTIGLLVGAAILLLGRKLFWLFFAAIGFALGAEIAPRIMTQPAPVVTLIIAIALGFVGAVLAILLQKVAIAASGFLAGGWFAVAVYTFFAGYVRNVELVFLIGGILGAIVFFALFDLALIVFSSVVGARFIALTILLPQAARTVLFILLVIVGVVVQRSMLSPARRTARWL
jgi:hypothetical protein